MIKGNGSIRACIVFVLFVMVWILAISEYTEARFIEEMPIIEIMEIDCDE